MQRTRSITITKGFEYLALVLVILGVWFIAEVNVVGQYFMLLAQVLWIIVGLKRTMWGLAIQSGILLLMTARAIYLWQFT